MERRSVKESGVLPSVRRSHWTPLALLPLFFLAASAIRFEVTGLSKCIGEEIQMGVLVVGDFQIVLAPHQAEGPLNKISVKVNSPFGHSLYFQENIEKGQFGFTTKEGGQYMACFNIAHGSHAHSVTVDLNWKTGVAAKDWSQIAKKDKLDGMGLELRKLEESIHSIREEMRYFKTREAEMRDLNEATNARVAWLSIASLFVCIALAALQLWHLKSYFERKKLL